MTAPLRAFTGSGLAGPLFLAALVPAAAQEAAAPLPDYATCMAGAVAHFESEFHRTGVADEAADFDIMARWRVQYCGTLGIVRCDRSDDPLGCQAELARDQWALRAAILASLPKPDPWPVTGEEDPDRARALYFSLWHVAQGSSAGPDCDGATPVMAAWCGTHEANLKVGEAVLLWQLARLRGTAGPAREAGWIGEPPPTRPVPRPQQ